MEISLPEEDGDDETCAALFVKLELEGGRDCSISVKRRRKFSPPMAPTLCTRSNSVSMRRGLQLGQQDGRS